jgi:programmed cell death protein 5
MSGIPNNIVPADIAPSELPDGFSLAGGGGGGSASSAPTNQSAQRDAQRQAVLEQAMTPEALARLRRVKVSDFEILLRDMPRIHIE